MKRYEYINHNAWLLLITGIMGDVNMNFTIIANQSIIHNKPNKISFECNKFVNGRRFKKK